MFPRLQGLWRPQNTTERQGPCNEHPTRPQMGVKPVSTVLHTPRLNTKLSPFPVMGVECLKQGLGAPSTSFPHGGPEMPRRQTLWDHRG